MRSLTAVVAITVNIHFAWLSSIAKSNQDIANIFEALGYSPVCIASALASCERFAKPDCYLHVLYLMPELKSLLQGIKCENKPEPVSIPKDTLRNMEVLRKEGNSEQSHLVSSEILKNLTDLFAAITDLKEIKTVINDLKDEKSKCSSIKSSVESQGNLMIKHDFESSQVTTKPKNCAEVPNPCLATIYPYADTHEDFPQPVVVTCVDTSDGGKWTVIQNRDIAFPRQNFYRPWSDYVKGFGDLNGEFWLGLENIHALTNATKMELRVDLEDYDGVKKWARYDSFKVGDASTKYVLTLGTYSGDAGNSLAGHNGMKFSTYDQDNDKWTTNCALTFRGAWWYTDCHSANLNGYQYIGKHTSFADGINWKDFRGYNYSLKKTSMKIRPA